MPSFDIVSEINLQEIRNAVDQADREIRNRFDFKGTESSIELGDGFIKLESSSEAVSYKHLTLPTILLV